MAYFARPQSRNAAVKIVTPTTQEEKAKSAAKKGLRPSAFLPRVLGSDRGRVIDLTQRQCRNILIYGYA
jgi:hypothetical protein